jgi:hypothetical protein
MNSISFFQTYGNRFPLIKIREEDKFFQKFIRNFDMNIISLHNVTPNVSEYLNKNWIIPNQTVWDSSGKSYGQCIKFLVNFLLVNNVDRFFFYQDDTFSYEINELNIYDLLTMIFNPVFDHINISYKLDYLKEHKKWNESKNIIYEAPSFNLYDTTTVDFKKSGLWSFDDSCFVCSRQKLLEIYDESYWNYSSVWEAECYLESKFSHINMLRPITDISFFINYNILGRNTDPKNWINLKEHIQLSEETKKLL